MSTVMEIYARGLAGRGACYVAEDGASVDLPVGDWLAEHHRGDEGLLDRCAGRTLDVGCGPGRLTVALADRHVTALGIDISRAAIALATARGATALRRDVFGRVPRAGAWRHLLLADGNIGIGGDPVRLLRRCADVIAPDGTILLDLAEPGTGLWQGPVRLRSGPDLSDTFRWARVGVEAIDEVASAAGLSVRDRWRSGGRWQAELVHRRPADAARGGDPR